MSRITTWRTELAKAFAERGEVFAHDDTKCTLTCEQLDTPFYSGYGRTEGHPFTAWGPRYVYFPVQYDGAEWVGSVPRYPCDEATEHLGGG